MNKKGVLIVISGFSGVGKGTVVKKLIEKYRYSLSVSATTRAPRPGETDGVDYHFKTVAEFQNLIDYNGFIEWAQYVENYYGTPRKFVEDELAKGNNVILEIEVQGAMHIKEQYPDAVLIFITAPDAGILKQRLEGRGTEEEKVIAKRLKRAYEETDDMAEYDYLIVNDDLDTCVEDIHSVIKAESFRTEKHKAYTEKMKKELLDIRKEILS
ncbi:MAG: guanylate kinase [Bacteroidales bacterium]|nr:guanylate kinase [Clostridium sp.]MCM1202657.1 guanylate kinase [Bacteroidales bacterium]